MPNRSSNKMTITEYQVREIDADGDAIDVQSFDAETAAVEHASHVAARGAVAVVVEKHIARYPAWAHETPDTYRTISTQGDPEALRAGGWIV